MNILWHKALFDHVTRRWQVKPPPTWKKISGCVVGGWRQPSYVTWPLLSNHLSFWSKHRHPRRVTFDLWVQVYSCRDSSVRCCMLCSASAEVVVRDWGCRSIFLLLLTKEKMHDGVVWLDLTVFVITARFFTRMCVLVPERKRPDRPNFKGLWRPTPLKLVLSTCSQEKCNAHLFIRTTTADVNCATATQGTTGWWSAVVLPIKQLPTEEEGSSDL